MSVGVEEKTRNDKIALYKEFRILPSGTYPAIWLTYFLAWKIYNVFWLVWHSATSGLIVGERGTRTPPPQRPQFLTPRGPPWTSLSRRIIVRVFIVTTGHFVGELTLLRLDCSLQWLCIRCIFFRRQIVGEGIGRICPERVDKYDQSRVDG